MKKLRMLWASLCVMALTALCAVPAWADLILTPKPTPEPTPEPAPTPDPLTVEPLVETNWTLLIVLIAAVVLIAAAVIAWVVARSRRRGAGK